MGGMIVCTNSHGHMTKMAVTPIYCKNSLKNNLPLWNLKADYLQTELLAKELALSTGKLPRRLAKEQLG